MRRIAAALLPLALLLIFVAAFIASWRNLSGLAAGLGIMYASAMLVEG